MKNGMELALCEARNAAERGEVPVGAVVLGPDGTVLAQGATGWKSYRTHPPMRRCWSCGKPLRPAAGSGWRTARWS